MRRRSDRRVVINELRDAFVNGSPLHLAQQHVLAFPGSRDTSVQIFVDITSRFQGPGDDRPSLGSPNSVRDARPRQPDLVPLTVLPPVLSIIRLVQCQVAGPRVRALREQPNVFCGGGALFEVFRGEDARAGARALF